MRRITRIFFKSRCFPATIVEGYFPLHLQTSNQCNPSPQPTDSRGVYDSTLRPVFFFLRLSRRIPHLIFLLHIVFLSHRHPPNPHNPSITWTLLHPLPPFIVTYISHPSSWSIQPTLLHILPNALSIYITPRRSRTGLTHTQWHTSLIVDSSLRPIPHPTT